MISTGTWISFDPGQAMCSLCHLTLFRQHHLLPTIAMIPFSFEIRGKSIRYLVFDLKSDTMEGKMRVGFGRRKLV